MTIEQTVEVPASRRLTIDVPREVPVGRTIIAFTPAADTNDECPLCAKSHTPNTETAAVIREGRAMMRGEIPSKLYNSLEEMLVDLDSDD